MARTHQAETKPTKPEAHGDALRDHSIVNRHGLNAASFVVELRVLCSQPA
jgi:hypothetical protein